MFRAVALEAVAAQSAAIGVGASGGGGADVVLVRGEPQTEDPRGMVGIGRGAGLDEAAGEAELGRVPQTRGVAELKLPGDLDGVVRGVRRAVVLGGGRERRTERSVPTPRGGREGGRDGGAERKGRT